MYLLSSKSLLQIIASMYSDFKGRFKAKYLALSSIPGNIMSNPNGVCCFWSVSEPEFNSINWRPETKERINIHFFIFLAKIWIINLLIPLFIWFSPMPHRFKARTHANVDDRASLTNKGWRWGRPQEPSLSWLSTIHFAHSGKRGTLEEFGDGTIATQAVSYEETESSILSNIFWTLSLVPSNH